MLALRHRLASRAAGALAAAPSAQRQQHQHQQVRGVRTYDVVVAGGSVMGLSTAYHLLNSGSGKQALRVCVVERDPSYAQASATLSAGGIRQQFSLPLNVSMTMYGIDFLKGMPQLMKTSDGDTEVPDIQLRENGYLFLASTPEGQRILGENVATQHRTGSTWIKTLAREELHARFPWCKSDDILSAALGTEREGWFDPWSYINALKRKLKSQGVEFVQGAVTGLGMDPKLKTITQVKCKDGSAAETSLSCKYVVNSMGPFANSLVQMAEASLGSSLTEIPVRPRKRVIYVFHCTSPHSPPSSTPLVVDPSGVYFRPEGLNSNRFICGVSPPENEDPDYSSYNALAQVDDTMFEEVIWPALYNRVPDAFGEIKVKHRWAGFYDYNIHDQNGIIGKHTEVPNLYLCNGFSGHGLQQSPAAGRAVAELILHGKFTTLDLMPFGLERFAANRLQLEANIV